MITVTVTVLHFQCWCVSDRERNRGGSKHNMPLFDVKRCQRGVRLTVTLAGFCTWGDGPWDVAFQLLQLLT